MRATCLNERSMGQLSALGWKGAPDLPVHEKHTPRVWQGSFLLDFREHYTDTHPGNVRRLEEVR